MLRSCAPAAAPMRTKSPSLVMAAHPPKTGAERKFARSSGSCVKPPEAKITALRAATRTVCAGGVGRLDAGHTPALDHEPLDAVRDAHVDAVALGRRAHRADADLAAVGHRRPRSLGHEHAAGRRLVLGQLGPVVGHRLAPPIRQRVACSASSSAAGEALS